MTDASSCVSTGLTVSLNSLMISSASLLLLGSVMAKVKSFRSGMEFRYQMEFLFSYPNVKIFQNK